MIFYGHGDHVIHDGIDTVTGRNPAVFTSRMAQDRGHVERELEVAGAVFGKLHRTGDVGDGSEDLFADR